MPPYVVTLLPVVVASVCVVWLFLPKLMTLCSSVPSANTRRGGELPDHNEFPMSSPTSTQKGGSTTRLAGASSRYKLLVQLLSRHSRSEYVCRLCAHSFCTPFFFQHSHNPLVRWIVCMSAVFGARSLSISLSFSPATNFTLLVSI